MHILPILPVLLITLILLAFIVSSPVARGVDALARLPDWKSPLRPPFLPPSLSPPPCPPLSPIILPDSSLSLCSSLSPSPPIPSRNRAARLKS